ncbi:E3 ubiquitin-protein ligase march6 [Chamberlinius hualienensis]
MDDLLQQDICRVCRSEGTADRPLYHPCICTGSIRYIHQECLVQWLRYSKKEYCELCSHNFSFAPIYAPDMPKRLPIRDIVSGLLASVARAVRYWFHYTLVTFAWLGVVPLTACRIYRCLFTGSSSSVLTLPLDMLSTDNLLMDSFHGCIVVICTLCAFISLVWLREQILHGGGPEWLERDRVPELLPPEPLHVEPAAAANENVNNVQLLPDDGGGEEEDDDEPEELEPEVVNNVAENVAVQPEPQVANEANNAAQDDNWNPIEWDRAAEELTWERLLGLDGSLVFLEHVFWVVSLNTLFILVFAFLPYHIGQFIVTGLNFKEYLLTTHFDGLLTTLCGYVFIGASLVVLHALASVGSFTRTRRALGIGYVVVKVSLLMVLEVGVFPLACGWWVDICSLALFDANLKDREASFRMAPGTSMFLHWLVGMVCVFYFASFILLLREVLRPGVLWFVRNLNDPDFNPIQEMIHLPILRHTRRFIASMVTIGTIAIVMLWIPTGIVKRLFPGFLPYHVILSSDTPVSELPLELLLLQVVFPALLEQGHTRVWLKRIIKVWCIAVSWLLDIRSYLLGDMPAERQTTEEAVGEAAEDQAEIPPPPPPNPPQPQPAEGNNNFPRVALGVEHHALIQVGGGAGGPTGFQPYIRPSLFAFRVITLLVLMCISLTIASTITMTTPVWVGRQLMSLWLGDVKIHELYTCAWGLYTCWMALRLTTIIWGWVPQGRTVILNKIKQWSLTASKMFITVTVVLGIIPLLLGILFDVIVIMPIRVPLYQTPSTFLWQDWALGILHTKIICAITMMGPNWWLKEVIEQVYQDGLRNINIRFILRRLMLPVVVTLGLALAVPYVIVHSFIPLFGKTLF